MLSPTGFPDRHEMRSGGLVMQRSNDDLSASGTIPSRQSVKRSPQAHNGTGRAGNGLPPAQIVIRTESADDAKSERPWSRAFEILRWRGPGRFLLLALREVLRPLVYWHAYYIIQNEML